MRNFLRVLVASAIGLIFAAPGFSQEMARNEIFGWGGWGKWWDEEGLPLRGLNGGGGVGRRLLPQFSIEGEVNAFRGIRTYFGPAPNYRARGVQATGNGLLYVVQSERNLVFVLLGAGVVRSTTEQHYGDYHFVRTRTGLLANAGVGAKVFLSRHLALRPEVRLIAAGAGSPTYHSFNAALRLSVGLGYHW